ncbi:hypothetical protein [Mesorhizobium sp. M0203]|uniref:hypothetical protein n=1 Tax=Mesorhizobium sp. M0203 TaxID=2956912 RepID=UPI0033390FF8
MLPVIRNLLLRNRSAFSPLSLFARGEVGVAILPGTEFGVAYQERTGASATTVCAHGDPVGTFHDLLTSKYITTDADSKRPLYQIEGTKHYLLSDGTDDWLRALFSITQPWDRVSALRQVSWVANDFIFGGGNVDAGRLSQRTSSPRIAMYDAGTIFELASAASPAIGADAVVVERHNGASSGLGVNNNVLTTGSPGTTAPGGVTLFARQDGGVPANVRLYASIMRAPAMTDAELAAVKAYAATRGGVTLG